MPRPSRLLIAPDVRTAEARLFDELDDLLPVASPDVPAAPVRVVVPSRSLRTDLLGRLALRRSAWLGLEVATARAFAHGILARAGVEPPRGAALFELELARQARRRRPLAAAFGDFADGWTTLAAAARDLVDAGFEPAHLDGLVERVEAEGSALPRPTRQRALALLETLAATIEALAARGLAPESALYARAADAVRAAGHGGRAVLLHGFADATGVLTDLFEAVGRTGDLTAVLVVPSAAPGRESERAFGGRLRARLAAVAPELVELPARDPAPAPSELVASSPRAEARAVVAAARAEIDSGVLPERIGLVVRDPGLHRAALRRELGRRGVPCSGSPAVGPSDPAGHRSRALLRAIEERERLPLDVALDLVGPADLGERSSVRLALRARGCGTLGDAVGLARGTFDGHRDLGVPLPVRAGRVFDDGGGSDDPDRDATARIVHRRLPVETLARALAALRRLANELGRWPTSAGWADHRRALSRLAAATGLDRDTAGRRLLGCADRLADELPAAEPLTRGEALELLRDADAEAATIASGAGGGVQLLTVVEARGRTFARLFVLGLVRGSFPRPVSAEPVLSDALRSRLRELLPDLPVKGEGHDEERFLFAQLAGAADALVLSRATHDDDGRPLAPSPLIDALRRDGRLAPWRGADDPLEPLLDQAIAAGLAGDGSAHARRLPLALEEGRRRFGADAARATAPAGAARLRVLAEYETDPATAEGRGWIRTLGPYFGFLGRVVPALSAAATSLEAQARCAWQAFLEDGLRLEPLPDPVRELPALDARWVGNVVHRVLQRCFADPGGGEKELDRALARAGVALLWPAPERVEELLREEAKEVLRQAGLERGGLQAALAARARGRLAAARTLDEDGPPALLLGSELDGALELEDDGGRRERVAFRVDRASREGELTVLTDFKTGAPGRELDAARPARRRERLLEAVRAGTRLQAALYATASAVPPTEARYLFLAPDLDGDRRILALDDGEESRTALAAAARTLLGSRRRGLHPPRLLEPDADTEYEGCKRCAVAGACVRGDSGFRLRLARWHESERGRTGARSEDEERLWRLWRLPAGPAENAT